MNKAVTLIILCLLLLSLIGGIVYVLLTKNSGVSRVQTSESASGLTVNMAADQNTTSVPAQAIPSDSGGASTNTATQSGDILSNPDTYTDPVNKGTYYLGYHMSDASAAATSENPPYVISYMPATHYFNIVLLQEPIGEVRKLAEQYLMSRLDLTQDEMCRLNYSVGVPNSVSQLYAGSDLRFSFCSGATTL